MNPSLKLFIIVALLVFIPLLVAHKMGYFGKMGRLQPNKKVHHQFLNNELPSKYRYFERSDAIKGTIALAGIAPEYTIGSAGWNSWTPDEASLERFMQRFLMQNAYVPMGYQILNPDKEVIGIFYSTIPDPAVHFKSGSTIKFALQVPQHLRQEK